MHHVSAAGPLEPGPLLDGDLTLALVQYLPGRPSEGYVPMYRFHMRRASDGVRVGEVDLRIGLTDALRAYGGNVGYWVDPEFRGHRYAARAVRLLFGLARAHGMEALWITCAPENVASRRTCEIVGGVLADVVPLPADAHDAEPGRTMTCRYRVALPADDRERGAP
jgi:predicted acetyltransferase